MPVVSSVVLLPLRQVQQAQSRALDFQQSYDVTGPQMSVLGAIVSNPGIDQRTVSALTFVDKSTVADVIYRLVERGLVLASRSELDGRRDRLVATHAAIAIVYEATLALKGGNDAVLADLSPGERKKFLRLLERIGYAGREEPESKYGVPSPDGVRPPLAVTWGLGRPLRACLQRYNRLWNEHVRDVTSIQWLALAALAEGTEIDQRTLGGVISLDKASLTEMLDRLLRRGLLEKRPDSVDRRRRLLKLTPSGHALVAWLTPRVKEFEEAFLAPLDELERRDFSAALTRVARDYDPRRGPRDDASREDAPAGDEPGPPQKGRPGATMTPPARDDEAPAGRGRGHRSRPTVTPGVPRLRGTSAQREPGHPDEDQQRA